MLTEEDSRNVIGATAYGADGDKIGKIGQLYLDDQSGRPEFVTVNTGLFATSESFVPVADARLDGDKLMVPFDKQVVKDAPNIDVDNGHLEPHQEQEIYRYYGLSYNGADGIGGDASAPRSNIDAAGTTQPRDTTGVVPEGRDTSGPETDSAMTRSEEHLEVGTTKQEAGRARLRKYVTTEQETHTVPVRKEKAVLETEPVTEANVDAATDGPTISDEEHEVVLSEEQVEVSKQAQPVERVRLGTETVTEQQTVADEVRKEHIEAEGDVETRR
jgi:uncharacterized protein (TIGR02271 family)